MSFTNLEKSAVIKVLGDIMLADGNVDLSEREYMMQIFNELHVSSSDIDKSFELSVQEGIDILSQMNDSKKSTLSLLMGQMIEADHNIDEKEMRIFHSVLKKAGIPISQD